MEVKQHYLINLKRRPERLYAWLGGQAQRGFDFEKLTVVEAYDGTGFNSQRAVFEPVSDFLLERGLDYTTGFSPVEPKIDRRGIAGLLITTLCILLHQEERIHTLNADDYFLLWEDDVYLNCPYRALIDVQLPEDATMIALFTPPNLDHLKKHLTLPFRHGAKGVKPQRIFAFNKEGLTQILNGYRKERIEYDLELFFLRHPDLPGFYSSEKTYGKFVWFEGLYSDIAPWKTVERKDAQIHWNTWQLDSEAKNGGIV